MYFNKYHEIDLTQYEFLVTGGAGFIGSNLVEYLVQFGAKKIRILDNLSTGYLKNISDFINMPNVEFTQGDIRSYDTCLKVCENVDFVLHQAALGSVPRSINDPLTTNEVNIGGFLNVLTAAKNRSVKRMVYAASSSTYGDSSQLPKIEDKIGKPLSPYAVTKFVNELYSEVFSRTYGFHSIGLRYFNVFGHRQNPQGEYAAVIPLFISKMLFGESVTINGSGENSRDFTFVSNVVQANIKALFKDKLEKSEVYNIACGQQITLIELVVIINKILDKRILPIFREGRKGDVLHSLADISKAKRELNYYPEVLFEEGIKRTILFFEKQSYF